MSTDQTRPTDDQSGSRAHVQGNDTTAAELDVDVIEARVIAAGDAWRAEAPASVAALIYDAGALLAEVRRLTAALAEAEAGYDAQVQHGRRHYARAERAEAALGEVAALADRWASVGWLTFERDLRDTLARAEASSPSGPDSTPGATDETRQVVGEPVAETFAVAVSDPCDDPVQVQHHKRCGKNGGEDVGGDRDGEGLHGPSTKGPETSGVPA